jgi:hypothetical protein
VSGPLDRKPYTLPCGAVAIFDRETECSWRCQDCFAVVGSVGMPERCRQALSPNSGGERE